MQDNRRQGETAVFFSHSENQAGGRNLLPDHLRDVGGLAGDFAGAFGARAEGEAAGSLHDLGKYGELFKKRLSNEITGVDHWTAGAFVALNSMGRLGIASALAIEGHHIGLQRLTREHLRNLKQLNPLNAPEGLKMSGDLEDLIERFKGDGFQVPKLEKSIYEFRPWQCTASLLDIRMLFSALVDADYLATEAHFNCAHDGSKLFRAPGPDLQASQALTVLDQELSRLAAQRGQSSQDVHALRQDLLSSCRRAAEWDRGLFTLTAPTGAGKTLSMLAFALKHAAKHGLRRIIVVIPYLSIIDQTARTYRALFQPRFGSEYVLEHHSLAVQPKDKDSRPDESRSRLLSENWDAPLIVTTSVQMLESLFAHRPAACRKLHRIASSVILFDEVQTLPAHLAIPSLAAVSHLVGRYGCSVVFSTATQPAFGRLDREVSQECPSGWRPREIVPFDAGLFSRARRVSVDWPKSDQDRVTWQEVARRMVAEPQVLCIVNVKRHAIRLVKLLKEEKPEGLFHLSTNMCPAHREEVLDQVRKALERGRECRLVSTQCIEAGVDIDFPAGFRAFGPFDAVAQAGGRVNRGGRSGLKTLWVFHPPQEESGIYPGGAYRQAADTTLSLLTDRGDLDIYSTEDFEAYYRELFSVIDPEGLEQELRDAIRRGLFPDIAACYRLIPDNTVNVLVPYLPRQFEQLLEEAAAERRLTRHWIREARPLTISLYEQQARKRALLAPVLERESELVPNTWFYLTHPEAYDNELLGMTTEPNTWIG